MIGDDPRAYAHEEDGRPVPATPFDYGRIDEAVFDYKPESDLTQFSQEDVDRALKVFRELLRWVFQNGMKNPDGVKIRAILVCWIFLEELRGLTLTELAAGYGMKKQSFGRWLDEWKLEFKIRTPHMRPLPDDAARTN